MKRFIACELAKKTANSHRDETFHLLTLHGIRTRDYTITHNNKQPLYETNSPGMLRKHVVYKHKRPFLAGLHSLVTGGGTDRERATFANVKKRSRGYQPTK